MRILITAGPTRAYIDTVRFITNASSGLMGCALAARAVRGGHEVVLLTGPVALAPPAGCEVVHFVTVSDLADALTERFGWADALVMAAAVGDFQVEVENPAGQKLSRSEGPIDLRLAPTEDLLAAAGKTKRADQTIVAFAVNDGTEAQIEAAGRKKLAAKGADFIVLNTPEAMSADRSRAAVLSPAGLTLGWAERSKADLAGEILKLIELTGQR